MKKIIILALTLLSGLFGSTAQVGIGTETPDLSSILEIESTSQGILIPRMTTAQRDAIASPAEGLQIYNITNNSSDIFSNGTWKSFSFSKDSNLVYVYSLADLPSPEGSAITLDETKMYVFSGAVDISPNYININGAGLRGTDPQKDQIISTVSGAILRSSNKSVYLKELAIVPASSSTQAYDFSDTTGNFFCNIFSGNSVVDPPGVSSLGVGTISGFIAITILQNYWNTANGVKIGGAVGKFTSGYNFIVDVTNGAGIEILADAVIEDIDVANNYFIYTGETGFKVASGATVERGRLTTNMFRGVGVALDGLSPHEIGWSFLQNTDIADTKSVSFVYFNDNTTTTTFANTTNFVKVAGTTTAAIQQKFTAGNNRLTYNGNRPIVAQINASVNATSPGNGSSYTISVFKNGQFVSNQPINTVSELGNNNQFQLSLNTEIGLSTTDYIEVFIRSNVGTTALDVKGLQFNATD